MYLSTQLHSPHSSHLPGRADPRIAILVSVLLPPALLSSALSLTGCVSMPAPRVIEAVGTDELSDHVHFLSQLALNGRKPRTRGSALARRYISRQFKECGLVPWGRAKGFAQPFGLGTNVVGVLPGADPNLVGEVVIVAAHYDHLGKTEKGTCLGACDNASGVAALLEIAESLALREERPRRPVCFAAFDCEETFSLGAFAFTCRDDFDESGIAGVVNIDMLGRDAFAVLDDCLFMTGTEPYPDLRTRILPHVPDGLTLLPMGAEIAGPRGDHIAFETVDRPVLFFSCGPYEDYHRPADTPEKIDYECVRKSVDVITRAVDALAGSDRYGKRDPSDDGHVEELEAFQLCLSKVRSGHEALGWTETQAQRLDPVIEQVEQLLAQRRYTQPDRVRLLRTAAQPLIPLALWPDSIGDPNDPNQSAPGDSMIVLQTLYAEHRLMCVQATRTILKTLLSQRTNLLLGRTVNSVYFFTDVPDHLIFVDSVEPARYRLSFLNLKLGIGVHINRPFRVGISINYFLVPSEFTGTRDELTDYCLLLCHNPYPNVWLGVLRHVTGTLPNTTYEQVLDSRRAEGNWAGEEEWILDCARSENPMLRYMALGMLPKVTGPKAEPILLGVLADPNAALTDRKAVVSSLSAESSAEMLIAVAGVLSDRTRIKHPDQEYYERLTRPGTPFEGYPLLPLTVKRLKAWLEKEGRTPRTIADLAQERLTLLTNQGFDKNAAAAREWIRANWPPGPQVRDTKSRISDKPQ